MNKPSQREARIKRFALRSTVVLLLVNVKYVWDERESHLSDESLRLCKAVHQNHGFIFLQIINAAYVSLTLNWICQVSAQVLSKTVFLATDDVAASALRKAKVQFVVERFGSHDLVYGTRSYYSYMLQRTRVVETLLRYGINVWIIESDATWFGDPTEQLKMNSNFDVIAGQDGLLHQNNAEGGFIFLNSTPSTIKLWQKIRRHQEAELSALRHFSWHRKPDAEAGNEMVLLQMYLGEVRWTFFDKWRFVSGLWYMNDTFRNITNPLVIQNNWIKGNEAKIRRAQLWLHWYLLPDNSCSIVIKSRTSIDMRTPPLE